MLELLLSQVPGEQEREGRGRLERCYKQGPKANTEYLKLASKRTDKFKKQLIESLRSSQRIQQKIVADGERAGR